MHVESMLWRPRATAVHVALFGAAHFLCRTTRLQHFQNFKPPSVGRKLLQRLSQPWIGVVDSLFLPMANIDPRSDVAAAIRTDEAVNSRCACLAALIGAIDRPAMAGLELPGAGLAGPVGQFFNLFFIFEGWFWAGWTS